MTNLFNRKVEVILAVPLSEDLSSISAQATKITDLRVTFKVTKSLVKDPNTCEIRIFNLSESTRKSLPGTGAKVVLRAGYEGTLEQIYIGDARQIESKQESADWVTKVLCGDGYRAAEGARVSESFAAGTPFGPIIAKLGRLAKLDIGNLDKVVSGLPSSAQYTQGYTAHGLALTELDKVLKAAGFDGYSIQDGALLVLKPGESTTEEVIVLDESSGLVGSPEMSSPEKKTPGKKSSKPPQKPVLQVKSLLQGGFRCGRSVQVKSKQYDGIFRCTKVEHSGDSKGGEWYSALELEVST